MVKLTLLLGVPYYNYKCPKHLLTSTVRLMGPMTHPKPNPAFFPIASSELVQLLTSWMYLARIVRSQFLSLKEQDFIMAARCTGASNLAISVGHILPNSIAPIVVNATLGAANTIWTEVYISFLGLGVRPLTATWGNMLEDGLHPYASLNPRWTINTIVGEPLWLHGLARGRVQAPAHHPHGRCAQPG